MVGATSKLGEMPKESLIGKSGPAFSLRCFLVLTVFALVLGLVTIPSRAQDDNPAPPPPDNGAAVQSDRDRLRRMRTPRRMTAPHFRRFTMRWEARAQWIQTSDYGYVWQPPVTDPDWAPYTEGNWVYTDDGWTWVSSEPWGWATYHYGRWVNLDGTGWCWVPGYTWAPAWVSWRYGDGYCGWAPLPPDSFVGVDYSDDGFAVGVGFHIGGDCDGFYGIGPGWYNFLPVGCLGYRNYHGYYRHRGDNFDLINRTTNVTNINVERNNGNVRVSAGGPMLAQVNAVSQTPVPRVSLIRSNQPDGGGRLSGNSLALYRPHVRPSANVQPSRVAESVAQTTINRGTDIMRPVAVNSRLAPSPATETQVQQARIAQNHAPASAKVLTDSGSVQPVLQTPLTSMKPVTAPAAETSTVRTTPGAIYNTERSPSVQAVPTVRTYPAAGEANGERNRVYNPPGAVYPSGTPNEQPHSPVTGGGGEESHTYVRPTTPSYSPPASAGTQRESTSGNSGGGSSSSGAGERSAPSSSGAGGYRGAGGGGYQQSH